MTEGFKDEVKRIAADLYDPTLEGLQLKFHTDVIQVGPEDVPAMIELLHDENDLIRRIASSFLVRRDPSFVEAIKGSNLLDIAEADLNSDEEQSILFGLNTIRGLQYYSEDLIERGLIERTVTFLETGTSRIRSAAIGALGSLLSVQSNIDDELVSNIKKITSTFESAEGIRRAISTLEDPSVTNKFLAVTMIGVFVKPEYRPYLADPTFLKRLTSFVAGEDVTLSLLATQTLITIGAEMNVADEVSARLKEAYCAGDVKLRGAIGSATIQLYSQTRDERHLDPRVVDDMVGLLDGDGENFDSITALCTLVDAGLMDEIIKRDGLKRLFEMLDSENRSLEAWSIMGAIGQSGDGMVLDQTDIYERAENMLKEEDMGWSTACQFLHSVSIGPNSGRIIDSGAIPILMKNLPVFSYDNNASYIICNLLENGYIQPLLDEGIIDVISTLLDEEKDLMSRGFSLIMSGAGNGLGEVLEGSDIIGKLVELDHGESTGYWLSTIESLIESGLSKPLIREGITGRLQELFDDVEFGEKAKELMVRLSPVG